NLVDFERLLFLIELIIKYPGIGNLHKTHQEVLVQEFNLDSNFYSSIDEIRAVIIAKHGAIYADNIQEDLSWLNQQGILNSAYPVINLEVPPPRDPQAFNPLYSHPYSDKDTFKRLMQIISHLLHYPFLHQNNGALTSLHKIMEFNNVAFSEGAIRYDFTTCLKPYKIMSDQKNIYRNGYFLGTSILSISDLLQIFRILEG
ncbi:kinase, partial [Synechocystis salina LEGE 06155]|nr:kinase [Synechocystis salina LEGE 06155]